MNSPQLSASTPQLGLEIQRTPRSVYQPLRGLIAGPKVIVRTLELPERFVKLWLSLNWSRIITDVNGSQQLYPPQRDNCNACLVLTEFMTDSWTTVYDEGKTDNLSLLPMVLGYATGSDVRGAWNGLILPKPTMSARLGTGEWQVMIMFGCLTN
jgi:hypothetical protein